ncbi:hypothetical protein D6858_06540 [Tsuneonella suprasediminis]|jgi:hypothetical protein|uniref:Peptidase M10 metallopeptidase domain-containing protein n=1 Tax=Tsuneonella suprasediminis TaxID=2306996 RepID=A0A419R1H2_9SPHN|nr:matrixin family metalloprotease [Tsuneonella suprasediminis]RJX67659.1 hypothetical protein D6858_06540 [Tsuneonella suprasediminis]|tara:strand:- start:671 stop:1369 length:699 start_codon:yes stop_codon:yes gene_type:complete
MRIFPSLALTASVIVGTAAFWPSEVEANNCKYSSTNKNCPDVANQWTWGRQDASSLRFTINDSVPSACQSPAYAALNTWNSSTFRFSFVWGGYTTTESRVKQGEYLAPTSANRIDTVDINVGETLSYAAASTQFDWGTYNSAAGRYNLKDGDIQIAPGTLTSAYCGSGSTPNNMKDFRGLVAHELGHAVGLGHKLTSQTISDVMYGWSIDGPRPTVLSTPDRESAEYLYGRR